jgi:hypothetical protein
MDHVAVCVSMYPPIVPRQRLDKNPRIVAGQRLSSVKFPLSLLGNCYVFYAVHVVSKESRRLVLPRTSCFKMGTQAIKN